MRLFSWHTVLWWGYSIYSVICLDKTCLQMTLWSGYDADRGYTHAYVPTMSKKQCLAEDQLHRWSRRATLPTLQAWSCSGCTFMRWNQPHQGEHKDSPWLLGQHTSGSNANPADGSGTYVRRDRCLPEQGEDLHLIFGSSHYLNAGEFIKARPDYLQEQSELAISGSPGQLLPADNLSIASQSVENSLEYINNRN